MRRPLVVAGAILAIALLFLGAVSLTAPPTIPSADEDASREHQLTRFEDTQSAFFPFVNTEPRFRNHSPINVVVLGAEVDDVVQIMRDAGWNQTLTNETDAGPGTYSVDRTNFSVTDMGWGDATGATRYAYLHNGTEGTWVSESAQLHEGTYFGTRYHLRLYESPVPGEWVAVQAHTESFDWFSLRHAVDSVHEGQVHVEGDFMGQPFVDEVWRKHLGNAGPSDADGWATVIELAVLLPVGILGTTSVGGFLGSRLTEADRARLASAKARIEREHLLMAVGIVAIVLGVRLAGIELERHVSGLGPHAIAALLFPVFALGLPLLVYGFAHRTERRMDAGMVASIALGAAVLLDYSILGVDVLPISIVLHRVGVVLSIGLLAAGAARRATRMRHLNGLASSGLLAWVVLLALPLFGLV